MRIALIGVGNLGKSIATGLLSSGIVSSQTLMLCEREINLHAELERQFGAPVYADPRELAAGGDLDAMIIAVKPQDAERALAGCSGALRSETVAISVMAGISTTKLQSLLANHPVIVRAMPNLGARMGLSATAFFCMPDVSTSQRNNVAALLATLGICWEVNREDLIDVWTALAGSGPAYVCWLAEQMQSAAQELGLPEEIARPMVLQTLRGTVQCLFADKISPSNLREQVTSPGGTTAAALGVLKTHEVAKDVHAAIAAAFNRARELSKAAG